MRLIILSCLLWSQMALATTQSYVADALAIIEQNAMAVPHVDWPKIRGQAMQRARDGDDAHAIVSEALKALRDGHSFLLRPPASKAMQAPVAEMDRLVANSAIGIAYIQVRGFLGTHRDATLEYVRAMRADLAASNACGYVIDLRRNRGGNMWPAMLGLQPLLGDGVVGGSRDSDGNVELWRIYTNRAIYGSEIAIMVREDLPENVATVEKPVALLLGPDTASAAEALAIAFRGRANTRSYGWHTRGQTTVNQGFMLPDDARMQIAIADMVDRDGNAYRPYIEPDSETTAEILVHRSGRVDDDTRIAAERWLASQPACSAS